MTKTTRRKFLKITASTFVLSLTPKQLFAKSREKITWQGVALGAQSNMTLFHSDPSYAKETLDICTKEIKRLEKIFSIYDKSSSIASLNKKGFLKNPPKELVEVLNFANTISQNTNGAFDVSIQPLWIAHENYFRNKNNKDISKLKNSIKKAKKLVSYKNIIIDEKKINFKKQGMKITLNGIAQGYITDKITAILKQKGFTNVLVDLGEINSIGGYDNKRDWNIATPYLKEINYLSLNNNALASSGGYGTRFNKNYHHLFDTKTGTSAGYLNAVTVKAPNAMLADALSTAIYVMPNQESKNLMNIYREIEVYRV